MKALRPAVKFSPRLGIGAVAVAVLIAGLVVACGGGNTLSTQILSTVSPTSTESGQ